MIWLLVVKKQIRKFFSGFILYIHIFYFNIFFLFDTGMLYVLYPFLIKNYNNFFLEKKSVNPFSSIGLSDLAAPAFISLDMAAIAKG